MKDYSVLEGLDNNFMIELRCAYDRGYRHGRDDEWAATQAKLKEEEGYNRGLEDAWACCKRFLNSDDKVCDKIFGVSGWADFLDQSPSEAIEKFKEYDEKHFDVPDNCKIEVGDEVYVPDLNEYAIVIEIVSDDDGDYVRIIRSNGKSIFRVKDTVNLAGKAVGEKECLKW